MSRTPTKAPPTTALHSRLSDGALKSLGKARGGRLVIQDYCPFPQSLEWQLGQRYLQERGSKAFLHDTSPVPYVVNNDGTLSLAAARLFFESLLEADSQGQLDGDIHVLELGIGVGLFARLFLHAFQALSYEHGKDYYDRLCYVAGDYSERMLLDACRHGTFVNHPGRYRLRVVDALNPAKGLRRDAYTDEQAVGPFRAVFLNYLLDCLPATVLRLGADKEVHQLCVRTCLARGVDPVEHTGLSVEELLQKAQSPDPKQRQQLLDAFHLFASEYDYRPVDHSEVPHSDFALKYARSTRTASVVNSYGAIQALEHLLPLLHPQGFILANDYGQTQATGAEEFEHQRFSGSTFVGVNFPLLKSYFADSCKCHWAEPAQDNDSIHARLLGQKLRPKVVDQFRQLFGKEAFEASNEPVRMARALAGAGRLEAAASAYRQALERQPLSWLLMSEVARFLTFNLQSPEAGLDLARQALALNPSCSAELWNTVGDSLFVLGRTDEARHAFEQAIKINPRDVRAYFNLTFVHQRQKD